MGSITGRNLASVDLNLLLVLHTVIAERSATAAARRLHVTQSAVSNALARLRELLGDPLVVRSGRGLAPTPWAQEIAPALADAVGTLERLVQGEPTFDPRASTRRFTLAAADVHDWIDVPAIFTRFRERLPRASLRVVTIDHLIASRGLVTGEVDAALGPPAAAKERGLSYRPLYVQGAVLVVRRDHPEVRAAITREQFNRLPHVDTLLVQGGPGIGHKIASDFMAAHGLVRHVALAVPHFAAAAAAAARSDCLAGLPERIARYLCTILPLRVVRLPFPAPAAFEMGLFWHARSDADAGSRLFREIVAEALEEPRAKARGRGPAGDGPRPRRRPANRA
jgi:DNA-binding transcriptional LysR family regulator